MDNQNLRCKSKCGPGTTCERLQSQRTEAGQEELRSGGEGGGECLVGSISLGTGGHSRVREGSQVCCCKWCPGAGTASNQSVHTLARLGRGSG